MKGLTDARKKITNYSHCSVTAYVRLAVSYAAEISACWLRLPGSRPPLAAVPVRTMFAACTPEESEHRRGNIKNNIWNSGQLSAWIFWLLFELYSSKTLIMIARPKQAFSAIFRLHLIVLWTFPNIFFLEFKFLIFGATCYNLGQNCPSKTHKAQRNYFGLETIKKFASLFFENKMF